MHTSRNIRNAGTISIYLLFCNPVKIYEVWSMKTTCCSFTPVVRVCAALLGPLRGRNSTRCCRSAKLLVFTIMHSNTWQAVRVDAFGVREMVLGKSRQAHQRTIMHSNTRQALNASTRSVHAKWYWVNHGRLTSEQSCTRTLDRQRTIMHSNTRQALNASTRSVYAKW